MQWNFSINLPRRTKIGEVEGTIREADLGSIHWIMDLHCCHEDNTTAT